MPTPDGYYLSAPDYATFRELLGWWRKSFQNNTRTLPLDPEDGYQAPEVYVVTVPVGGIPARVGTTLGKAECAVRQVDRTTDALDLSQAAQVFVYNPSDAAVVQADTPYALAVRDKFGTYLVFVGGSVSTVYLALKRKTYVSGRFIRYTATIVTPSDSVPITYTDTEVEVTAYHVENWDKPVLQFTGLIADVPGCTDGASLGYSFRLNGLTGETGTGTGDFGTGTTTGCAEFDHLDWTLVYGSGGVWVASNTVASGTSTATLTVSGGTGTLEFSGGPLGGLTYAFTPWVCIGDVTLTRVDPGSSLCPYAPLTVTLSALTTADMPYIDPLSVVQAWPKTGDDGTYYLFEAGAWEDLFRLTTDVDPNGIVSFFRYYDQNDATWKDGRGTVLLPAE